MSASCKCSKGKHLLTDFSISWRSDVSLEDKQTQRKAQVSGHLFKMPRYLRHWRWTIVRTGDPEDRVWHGSPWHCCDSIIIVCLKCLTGWLNLLTVGRCCDLELAVENTPGKQPIAWTYWIPSSIVCLRKQMSQAMTHGSNQPQWTSTFGGFVCVVY